MAPRARTREIHYRVVRPHRHGWQVRGRDASRASVVTSTKPEAVGRALEILRRLGGGELIVQDAPGRTTDPDSVAETLCDDGYLLE